MMEDSDRADARSSFYNGDHSTDDIDVDNASDMGKCIAKLFIII